MLKVEPRQIGDSLFFRVSGGAGPARTAPAAETILHLRRERAKLIAERDRHQEAASDTEKAICSAIHAGHDASQHRQALARLDDHCEVISAEVAHVADLIASVQEQAIEHATRPLAAEIRTSIAAAIEPFSIPEELTHEPV